MAASPERTFGPEGRFDVVRELGGGGMGVVFEVADRRDGRHVALKALRHAAPELIYRLKREFRATAALVHPNVISLYELFVDDDDCCFTMELVDGVDILTWVGLHDHYAELPTELALTASLQRPSSSSSPPGADPPTPEKCRMFPACDLGRLRPALRQLALGIHAVHEAGFVHRDIKPQNVLVDHAGLVRVLDLGLATDTPAGALSRTDQLVGTVAYIAPEALRGARPAPAQDWYGFGIILYQALTGWLPFGGAFAQLVDSKMTMAPPAPARLAHGVPNDLDELCRQLLMTDPQARPTGSAILEQLDTEKRTERSSRRLTRPNLFAGRRAELGQLAAALERVKGGEMAVVHIKGPSGIGKSELVRELLRRTRAQDPRVVSLEGRCYPHELVTYRAIDPLIDNLSRLWTTLPDVDAHRLLPRHAATLARLFPVLARVPAIASMPEVGRPVSVEEERRRAQAALREVLQRLADLAPLVLILDDVHLVDASTADLLVDVFREPDAPVALLALVSRSDLPGDRPATDRGLGDPLSVLLRELGDRVETLEVPPLGHADAVVLARHALGRTRRAVDLDALVREAGGMPFFVIELARFAEKTEADLSTVNFDQVIAERITGVEAAARRLLEVVAVAGTPTPRRVASAAADLDFDDEVRQVRALRAAGLVRAEGSGDDETIEPYHDRIRSGVCRELSPAQIAARHRALAVAYEGGDGSAPDRLARHWLGAGEIERACTHALRAGRAAEAGFDFAGAAALYRIVLEHGALGPGERSELLASVGECVACTGQPREASHAFLEAADLAAPLDSLRLRSRAAGELLRGGYLERGVREIERVLHALGMKLAPTPRRALLNLILARLRLRLRGFDFTVREADEISPIERVRLDACYAVGIGLAMVDHLRGAEYNTRGLLLALQVGDRERLTRALFLEIGARASHGDRDTAVKLIAMTRRMNAPLSEGYAQVSTAAMTAWVDNDWRAAVEALDRAMAVFRDVGRAAGWEHDTCQIYRINALFWLGEIAEIERSMPVYLHEARRRGDRYALANLRSRNNIRWLALDDPDGAETDLDEALAGWPRPSGTYHLQSYYELIARVDIALYRQRPEGAAQIIAEHLPGLRRAHLLRIGTLAREVAMARVRVALALAAKGDRDAAAEAERQVKELMRSSQPVAPGLAHLFGGLLADLYGKAEVAQRELRAAVSALQAKQCNLYAAAATWRLGEVTGAPDLVTAARDDLAGRQVVSPERMVRLLAPSRT